MAMILLSIGVDREDNSNVEESVHSDNTRLNPWPRPPIVNQNRGHCEVPEVCQRT
jgi:hypothetical protein